jgi:hypothetical protein
MEEDPVTGSVLQKLNNQLDNGLVLYRSFARTDQWSVTRNANSYYWKTAEFVMRTLERVYKNPEYLCEVKRSSDYRPYGNRLYKAPTNGEMARCALKLAGRYVRQKSYAAWFRNQWTLAYKIDRRASRLTDTFYGFRELIPEKDRFWADPFPLKKDDRYYIFFEEFPYSTGKGYISVITLDLDGKPAGEPLKVLEIACHLSYPFVFSWEGEIYMMPETGAKKTIEIYRCERFPDRWRLDRTVMSNVRAVDATLHSSDGLWWLFVNIGCAGGSKYDELHLFFGESPFGPWRPHPQNPIHSDVRSARPAGRLFEYDGQLYRPAQDLSNRRTFGVVIHRVDSITPDEYTEHIVSRLEAVWNRRHLGSHTLNYADGLTVIDVMRRRSRIGS